MLVDLESQHLVELLLHHLAREAPFQQVTLAEMLPEPEQLVLRGADGMRTCELRLCAWRASGSSPSPYAQMIQAL
jgi:hypothetical protein